MATIPSDYRKDYEYLKELSDKGALRYNNNILQKLQQAAKYLPGLKNALGLLNIDY